MAAELPNCGDYEGKHRIMKLSRKISQQSRLFTLVGAAALLASVPLGAQADTPAQAPKADAVVAKLLSAKNAHGSCAVIAQLDGDLTPARSAQIAALGADVTRHLGFIHSAALTLPRRNLAKLAALPFVSHLSYDGAVRKCDEFTVASSGAGTAYQKNALTGLGIGVAVVDSGMRQVDDLNDPVTSNRRITAQQNFVPGTYDPTDWCGHGTHVSGIIGGAGQQSTGSQYTHTFYGIARRANLINVRVLDANGAGSVSTAVAGIQWVIANQKAYNIRVLNLSLGHPVGDSYTNDPLCQAVENAWKAGIVVVCAAGNNGRLNAAVTKTDTNEGWGTAYGSIQSPANDPYVITVGATKNADGNRADDKIATYSSRGPSRIDLVLKPDIVAPGNRIVSLYAFNTTLYAWNTSTGNGLPMASYWNGGSSQSPLPVMSGQYSAEYFVLSGTSMAAPVVSGAAALMLQASPNLTPDTIKARLMVSADKWLDPTGTADPCTYGAGYLNIPAALASTVTPTQPALSPQLSVVNGLIKINTNVIGSANIWGSRAVSGVSTLYGSRAVSGVSTINASRAVSGVSTLYSSSVWGDTSVRVSASPSVDLSCVALKGE